MARNLTPHVRINLEASSKKALLKSPEIQQKIDDAADAVVEQAQSTVHVVTGNLKRHIRKRDSADGIGRDIGVFEGADYADLEEERHPFIRPALDAAKKGKS